VSVIEPSDAVKRRNGWQTGGRRPPPPVNTLAWLGLVISLPANSISLNDKAVYVMCQQNFMLLFYDGSRRQVDRWLCIKLFDWTHNNRSFCEIVVSRTDAQICTVCYTLTWTGTVAALRLQCRMTLITFCMHIFQKRHTLWRKP